MKLFTKICLAVLLATALFAQAPTEAPNTKAPQAGRYIELEVAMPTSNTSAVNQDVWVEGLTISNNTAAPLTFTITNGEASPKAFATTVTIAANQIYVMNMPAGRGRKFTGGLQWSCSGSGMVAYFVGWVRN